MPDLALNSIVATLRAAPAWQRKNEISLLRDSLVPHAPMVDGRPVLVGDDTAAIETEDGYLLLAAEIMYTPLVKSNPYLAGNYAVLANTNDVYAMGGYPIALVDVILAQDTEGAADLLQGLRDGCSRYGFPLVGGHLTANGDFSSVGACILGKAKRILSSFNARPGDALLHATNLNGAFHPRYTFFNCTDHLPDAELRCDLAILPTLAEAGLCDACRDVSMAGILGSAMMLLEPSGVGAVIDLQAIPRPPQAVARFIDWLLAFPSYGFILSVRPEHVVAVRGAFASRSIACAVIGEVTASREVIVRDGPEESLLWDFGMEPFMGFSPNQHKNGTTIRR
ncbi:MAG TPA: sll0787 family AIR synthase-like protein [Chloroflexota bacterium]|nr:sll0787 family AIR synthase-like protein [Chloroflexota bacterium]